MATDNKESVALFGPATRALQNNTDPFWGLDLRPGGAAYKKDPFWDFKFADDLKSNWNKSFPYQILILKKVGDSYKEEAGFTLPISPQSLSISTPFAISTTVTLGGILEEHNGAPLRTISLTGTTGLTPLRNTTGRAQTLGLGEAVFGGTLNALRQTASAARSLVGAQNQPENLVDEGDDDVLKATGYYQFLLLQRFLESYINRKRFDSDGRDLRLAFAVWKESAIYLVTPVVFDVQRQAQSPMEYTFSLQFRAWRRIAGVGAQKGGSGYSSSGVGVRDPNLFARVLNGIQDARRVLVGARNTLKAIRADINYVLTEPIRQTVLLSKDILGVYLAASDLPANLISDLRAPILEFAGKKSNQTWTAGTSAGTDSRSQSLVSALTNLSEETGKSTGGSGKQKSFDKGKNSQDADPAAKILQDPEDHFETFDALKVSDLDLRPNHIKKVAEQRQAVRLLRRENFQKFRDDALQVLADYEATVGVGDSDFAAIYGRPAPTATREPTDDDWDVIYALSQLAQNYDYLAAAEIPQQDSLNSLDYVAGLASRSGIAFQVPRSKFAVPFPYGHTLEQLAAMYLGDPNRWHEIAVLNGLRAPYVDEEGFRLSLLTNGSGNQILVPPSENFFVGQKVWLSSTSSRREARRIQSLENLSTTVTRLVLDGLPDLQKFGTASQAFLQAFLPDTVNSQMQIFIPSDRDPGDQDFLVKTIPGIDYFDPLVQSGGIDLLLTPGGDLVFTADGDNRLAVGLTNIVQKVRLALGTPQGSLQHHPDYGLNLKPGVSTADVSAQGVLASARQLFRDDPGFTGVTSAAVQKDGSHLKLVLGVGISGTGQNIPVQVVIRR
jgi:hypothetical protein